jgi:hypothetical protein
VKPEDFLEAALEDDDWEGGLPFGMALQLRELLGDIRVVFNEETPTLSIEASGRGHVLRIGPSFVRRHVRSTADARLLLAHELLHAVRGHLRVAQERHSGLRSLQNLSLDILVNSSALSWTALDEHPGLFLRLYRATSFPECLLLPPVDLAEAIGREAPEVPEWLGAVRGDLCGLPTLAKELERDLARHLAGLGVRHAEALARGYTRGWLSFPDPAGYWAHMKGLFVAELGIDPEPIEVLLLGDHSEGQAIGSLPEGLAEQLGRAEAWLGQVTPVQPTRQEIASFAAAVVAALDRADGGAALAPIPVAVTTPLPRPGRRDLPLLAAGLVPALWHPKVPRPRMERKGLHVYVDTSGSMGRLCGVLFGLIATLGDRLDLPAWAWSLGEPSPLTREDLVEGRFRSRGGTDVAPVVEHAVERGFGRIVVLSDGLFETGAALVNAIEEAGMELTFVLAGPHAARRREAVERLGSVFVLDEHVRGSRRGRAEPGRRSHRPGPFQR